MSTVNGASVVRGLLVSGPDDNLMSFHRGACMALNAVARRKQTVHYTCMAEDLKDALDLARTVDVTVEEIVVVGAENAHTHDLGESYEVLHLGSHGMHWMPKKREPPP